MNNIRENDLDLIAPTVLYRGLFGVEPSATLLPGAGSARRYFRLSSPEGPTVVATCGPDRRENETFVSLSRAFGKANVRVPEVLAVASDGSAYLQQDLGDVALINLLSPESRVRYGERALRMLADVQTVDESLWAGKVMSGPFSVRQAMWDLNYFKYEFLKPCGIVFDEDALEDDFIRLSARLADVEGCLSGFMCRDFQSRNIIVKDDALWLIDFQGGRKGPLLYDAVSFLWQAKAGFTEGEREYLLGRYADFLSEKRGVFREKVLRDGALFAFFRTLQVLGAYGFRGLIERKSHFIESIPAALANLSSLLGRGVSDGFPELARVCGEAVASRFAAPSPSGGLTVKVFSFSYKKGYPEDLSGNGGGFMFDCRGMHNPGRYDIYKPLTGLDAAVRKFLEERGEARQFLRNAFEIVSPSVAAYLRRGFSSLQVGFGCTGGRHRSVYCADVLSGMLASAYPEARVVVCHREQGIEREVKP